MKKIIISIKTGGEVLNDFKKAFQKIKSHKLKSPTYEFSFDNKKDFDFFIRNHTGDGHIATQDGMAYPDWKERLARAKRESKEGRGIDLRTYLKRKIKKNRHPSNH